jgi:dephospho-CoA kinase
MAAPGPYQILVIPLLVEGDRAGLVDRVLVVDCPEELQIERLMNRDGETREGALGMLAAQVSRQVRLAAADDVIVNDGVAADLAARVASLDRKYRELAARN